MSSYLMTDRTRLLHELSLPAFVLDAQGRLEWVNEAFAALVPDWQAGGRPAFVDMVFNEVQVLAAEPDAPRTFVREVVFGNRGDEGHEYLLTVDVGAEFSLVGVLTEISHIRRLERNSEQHLRVEMLLSSISGRFVGTYDWRQAIQATLSDMAAFTDSDRVFVLLLAEDALVYADAFEWCRPGLEPVTPRLVGGSVRDVQWWHAETEQSDVLDIPDLAELPAEAREQLAAIGAATRGSLVLMPLKIGGKVGGAVGFTTSDPRSQADLTSLFVLDIVSQTLERVVLLQRKEAALEQSLQQLKIKQAQLIQSEKMASIGQIAAGVAHEINNPIGFVMGNVTAMQSYTPTIRGALAVCTDLQAGKPADAEVLAGLDGGELAYIAGDLDGILAESLEGCLRVRDIVENLKGFARTEQMHPRPTDLNACVESTLKIVWNELKYRCHVVKDLVELPPVTCYAGQINQVIMNLLVNAAHAIKTEGTVTIRTRPTDGGVVLSVTDTGTGIDPAHIPHLFEPFFTTKEPGKGTGLGLYVCHGIVERHHGHFVVESVVGEGTTVSVYLPLAAITEETGDA